MEQIISILDKIREIAGNAATCSAIEKDLMLQYTRDLYETILVLESRSAPVVQELTEEPEPLPEAVIEESRPADNLPSEAGEKLPESSTFQPEEPQEALHRIEENRVEELYLQDEADRSAFYSDIAVQAEDEIPAQILSFELEPELREEKPAPFQPRQSTDFRIWNKDIRSYIGINDKYNFISELFKGNGEAYEEILNEINQCEDKQDALRFLENAGITTLYQWKQDGFSEQIFYNVLSQFFAAR